MEKTVFHMDGVLPPSTGCYSWAVRVKVERLLFISGVSAMSLSGEVLARGDVEAQTRICFDLMGKILKEAGGSFDDVVKINFYVIDAARNRDRINRIRSEYFKNRDAYPASAMAGVQNLPIEGQLIEVDAIAALG